MIIINNITAGADLFISDQCPVITRYARRAWWIITMVMAMCLRDERLIECLAVEEELNITADKSCSGA
jgi:hypothetical protein